MELEMNSQNRQYWLWVSKPEYYLVGGDQDPGLEPGNQGSWTCHSSTRRGDLVFFYRTSPKNDIAYLFEVTSDAYLIAGWNNEWDGEWGCDFVSHLRFTHPLTLPEMRADPALSTEFSALRSRFQRRSFRIEFDLWHHLLEMIKASNPGTSRAIQRVVSSKTPNSALLEREIEDTVARKPAILSPGTGLRVYAAPNGVSGRQFYCSGIGRIDLLCVDANGYVVIEIKRGRADIATVGQIAMYMGWIKSKLRPARGVRGIVLSDGYDMRFEAALRTIRGLGHADLRKMAPRLGLKL